MLYDEAAAYLMEKHHLASLLLSPYFTFFSLIPQWFLAIPDQYDAVYQLIEFISEK